MTKTVIECREIEIDSPLFGQEQALRDAVLRAPLGRESSANMIERDRTGRHFVAIADEKVIACVGFYPDGAGAAELRHLVVAEKARRSGVARRLVAFAEETMAANGVRRVRASARVDAVPFYEAAGYQASGDVFMRRATAHRLVDKELGPRS